MARRCPRGGPPSAGRPAGEGTTRQSAGRVARAPATRVLSWPGYWDQSRTPPGRWSGPEIFQDADVEGAQPCKMRPGPSQSLETCPLHGLPGVGQPLRQGTCGPGLPQHDPRVPGRPEGGRQPGGTSGMGWLGHPPRGHRDPSAPPEILSSGMVWRGWPGPVSPGGMGPGGPPFKALESSRRVARQRTAPGTEDRASACP